MADMADLPITDPQLIAAIAERNCDEQWREFELIYRPVLWQVFRKQGLAATDCEDCCQRIFLKLVKVLATFQDDGKPASFRRWLLRIAKNETVSFWRHRAAQPATVRDSALCRLKPNEQSFVEFEESIELEYQRQLFKRAVAQVQQKTDERQWLAFWRTAVEGLPTPVVAKELGMTVGAIYVAKGRILKRLQEIVRTMEEA